VTAFKPAGVPTRKLESVPLQRDELEALRLADLDGVYHAEAAAQMEISRQTFGRLVAQARRKVADALMNGKALLIADGPVVERSPLRHFACQACGRRFSEPLGTGRPGACPSCGATDFHRTTPDGTGERECTRPRGRRQRRGGIEQL
jgi:predicted DNA-binding protein (UPF0251 family)